ncbi:MAG TPA: SGNH/GDSL hydrolase family protein [Myxococcaceae bacterium]|nr:SGNH/GDSL hydrolase family protein [Myxococcaceae bacterium]
MRHQPDARQLAFALIAVVATPLLTAHANTVNQNSFWTITRPGAFTTYRVVAYGDSIFAGWYGNIFSVVKRAAPNVAGEYLAQRWGTNVQIVRRAKSGARADDIYYNKIIADRAYMQHAATRVVMFEMCGNDYLQARNNFHGQTGTCNFGVIENALAACTYYMEQAMAAINWYAPHVPVKVIANLYYPGYDADNSLSQCTDPATGQPVNKQERFLPYLAKSNWRACNLARRYGFVCADSFAQFMGADHDSNGDGLVDSAALAVKPHEPEHRYVERITTTLRSTVRDSNAHLVNPWTSFDYILSDNVHQTYYGGWINLNIFTLTGSGSGGPDFADWQLVGGKNPLWDQLGHERMGWSIWTLTP